jgi:hypothetical protein
MEIKEYEEYTKEEKIELLNHWFYYYGKVPFTPEEWISVRELIETNPDRIFDYIAISNIVNRTIAPTLLLQAMASNELDKLFEVVPRVEDLNESMQGPYKETFKVVFDSIVHTYNNPEPAVPMDLAIIIEEKEKNK